MKRIGILIGQEKKVYIIVKFFSCIVLNLVDPM